MSFVSEYAVKLATGVAAKAIIADGIVPLMKRNGLPEQAIRAVELAGPPLLTWVIISVIF